MKFNTKKLAYLSRFKNEFLLEYLLFLGVVFLFYLWQTEPFNLKAALQMLGVVLAIGIGLGLYAHWITKQYFHEVELTDNHVILRGDSQNKPLTIELPISETDIFIESKGKGRGNVEYFIRFQHGSKTYDINRLFNWNYSKLLELFHAFKNLKNEKIIWDEKYLLEFMEKKSKKVDR